MTGEREPSSQEEPGPKSAEHHLAALRSQEGVRRWSDKFADAFRGLRLGTRGQSSFYVHFAFAAAVVVVAAALGMSRLEWAILILCIFIVLTAEMFNTSLEWLAKAIDRRPDERIGAALDIGSAAVLLAAIGAALVGVILLGFRVGERMGWWE
jgi:diacylglycerol kinase